jgi:hypothetical protein
VLADDEVADRLELVRPGQGDRVRSLAGPLHRYLTLGADRLDQRADLLPLATHRPILSPIQLADLGEKYML